MKEWTDLLTALTFLLLTVGGLSGMVVAFMRRGWLTSAFSLLRDRSIALGPLTLGPAQQAVALPTALPPASEESLPAAIAEPPSPADERRDTHWYALMKDGKYPEGVRLLHEEAARLETADERVQLLAVGYWIGFTEGSPQGAEDLRRLVGEHPKDASARMSLAHILARTSHPDQAEAELRRARDCAKDDAQRVQVIRQHAAMLCKLDRSTEAIQLLRKELPGVQEATARSNLLVGLAEAHLDAKPRALEDAMLAYELALREVPTNKDLRFTVAYKYGENAAPALAFYHYRVLIADGMASPMAFNNAGIAAGEVGFPVTTVDYLRRAEEKGETLATSNLASRLLSAGFAKEATDALRPTLTVEGASARGFSVFAEASRAREGEDEKIKSQLETIQRVRRWRLRYAEESLCDAADPLAFAGQYAGNPDLALTAGAGGEISGTFQISGIVGESAAVLTGRVRGKALSFTWQVVKPEVWGPRPSRGHGVLLLSDGGLSGFRSGGDAKLDARQDEPPQEWDLRRA